jgi:hypothetical protein
MLQKYKPHVLLKGELRPNRLFEDKYALGQKGYVNYQLEILLLQRLSCQTCFGISCTFSILLTKEYLAVFILDNFL